MNHSQLRTVLGLSGMALLGYVGLPYLLAQWWNLGVIREGKRDQRELALTFDDGPHPLSTPPILDALKDAGARATFFVLPAQAETHPELIRRMVQEGHQVEAHAEIHRHAWTRSPWGTFLDPLRAVRRVQAVTGRPVRLQRPAHGAYTLGTVLGQRAARVTGAHWSIEGRDWHTNFSAREVLTRLKYLIQPGSVVVLHDAGPGAARTVNMLPELLTELGQRGYRAVTLAELSGAGPQGWTQLKRRAFTALDNLYDHLGRIRYAGERRDNLFRIGVAAFPVDAPPDLKGGQRGSPALEFHVNNSLLVDLGPLRAVRQARTDFRAVAQDWQTRPEYAECQVIFCLSALSPLLALLGFQTAELPDQDARRLRGWANVLRRAYSTQNQAQRPKLSVLSRTEFLRRYGT